ncbi:response regulator containing a CheY-like receiver domain and an HD-GYP domain [Leptolyngbyaceae cyanobacterium JSC-12]|nr:response regulator containing a CheY-like receiver domain and an HD-GYP domain [Leptolyngbyaceae cyanobacterium JSC-12]
MQQQPMIDSSVTNISTTRRILFVDDEFDVRRVVQTCLEKIAHWTVIVAESGEEGLQKARTEQPDAIVLDVMMPVIDGSQFLSALLAQPETRSIPVVLLTAKADSLDVKQYEEMGIKGLIGKPFNPLTLHREIATALNWVV